MKKKKLLDPNMGVDPMLIMFGQMALAKAMKEKKDAQSSHQGR